MARNKIRMKWWKITINLADMKIKLDAMRKGRLSPYAYNNQYEIAAVCLSTCTRTVVKSVPTALMVLDKISPARFPSGVAYIPWRCWGLMQHAYLVNRTRVISISHDKDPPQHRDQSFPANVLEPDRWLAQGTDRRVIVNRRLRLTEATNSFKSCSVFITFVEAMLSR